MLSVVMLLMLLCTEPRPFALFEPATVTIDASCLAPAAARRQPDGQWAVRELSTDHKPDTPNERARITGLGGRVERSRCDGCCLATAGMTDTSMSSVCADAPL